MSSRFFRRAFASFVGLALPIGTIAVSTTSASADVGHASTIYTLSNEASGNRVLAFARSADGSLTPAGSYATGANGSGGGLGSQGAVVVSRDRQILLAVNAGSNSVSAFRVKRDGTLRLMSTASSGSKFSLKTI